jgi:heme O synthase-like polyprenyltransferase
VLFAVIFLWTPPHFWALAMKFRKDYAAANIPMLPVVASPATVVRKILWYSYAMVAATLALIPYAGWIYGVFAAALGVWFLAEAHRLNARVTAVPAQPGPFASQAAPFTERTGPVTAEAGPGAAQTRPFAEQAAPFAEQTALVAAQAGPVTAQAGAAASGPSPAPMRLFHLSIAYLTLLFAAVAVTALLPWGRW